MIDASATATEILKNLVLPGILAFTIMREIISVIMRCRSGLCLQKRWASCVQLVAGCLSAGKGPTCTFRALLHIICRVYRHSDRCVATERCACRLWRVRVRLVLRLRLARRLVVSCTRLRRRRPFISCQLFGKCVLSTLAGSLVYDLVYKTPLVQAFQNTDFAAGDYTREQLLAFSLLGALLGFLGAFFVRCVHSVYMFRKSRLPGTNRYVLLSVIGIIAALVQYPRYLFRLDPRSATNEFFSADNMESLSRLDVVTLILIKFPLVVVSVGLPVPAGVFIPCFARLRLGPSLWRVITSVVWHQDCTRRVCRVWQQGW